MSTKLARILWIVAVVAMALTAAMMIIGGIGTVCAAFLTESFPPLLPVLDYQWFYQRMVFIGIAIGIAGMSATFGLFRGGAYAYRSALIVLIAGTVQHELRLHASMEWRGKIAPVNVVFYMNLFTLILFLILGLPSNRNRVSFSRPRGKAEAAAAGGMASLIVGLMLFTVPWWVGDTHTFEGNDWTAVLQPGLSIFSLALAAGGLGVFVKAVLEVVRRPDLSSAHQPVVSS